MDIQRIKFPSVDEIYRHDPKLKKDDVQASVQAMEEWLKTQPHLPELTQFQINLFLHSCYYDLLAAQTTIENYFTFKTNSYLFNKVDEDLVRRVISTTFQAPLPKRTPDGDVVLLLRLIDPNSERYNCVETIKVLFATMVVFCYQDPPASGMVVVCDFKNASLGHLLKASVSAMKQGLFFVQEAAPERLKSINVVNVMPITGRAVSLVRPFLKKETYNLLKFHYSLDTLYEVVPKECLPEEYGGFLPSLHELQKEILRNILDHWEILQWHDTQKVDETKRIRKEKRLLGSWLNIFG